MKLRLICLLLACMLPAAASAQTDAAAEAESIPRYDVEIILFKNVKVPRSREFVLPASSPSKPEKMLDLSSADSVEAAREEGYELLPTDEYRLLDIVARLVESPRYELLLHAGWRQPGLERDKVMPVWVKGGRIYGGEYTSIDSRIEMMASMARESAEADGAERNFEFDEQTLESQEQQLLEQQAAMPAHGGLYELEGKISIALSRYLHTFTDLVLRKPRLTTDPELRNAATEAFLAANAADTRILNNHHLREQRRMRSRNLHYLDSPEFGMLILITPYEAAEGVEEALPEGDEENPPTTAQ
jgi:hypothetical protein